MSSKLSARLYKREFDGLNKKKLLLFDCATIEFKGNFVIIKFVDIFGIVPYCNVDQKKGKNELVKICKNEKRGLKANTSFETRSHPLERGRF
jgi:hypothetical protein